MLRSKWLTTGTLLAATLALGACRSGDDRQRASEKAQEAADKAEIQARQAEQKAIEARNKAEVKTDEAANQAAKAADEARAARDEFIARSNEKLAKLDDEIAQLETKAKARTDKATRDAIATLRQMRLDATTALENAKNAGQTDWARVSATFDQTFNKVNTAFDELAERVGLKRTEAEDKAEKAKAPR